jgi:hypothetical protein
MTLTEDPETGLRTGTITDAIYQTTYEIKPHVDLGQANLSYVDLRNTDLRNTDLRNTFLDGTNLEGANLEGAIIRDANLEGANLERANLQSTDLSGANLTGANLQSTDLSGANLSGANLSGANLSDSDFTNVRMTRHDWEDIRGSSINVDQAIGIPDLDSRRPEQVQSRPVPKGIQKLYENDKCPVCLEDYNGKDKCVMTNCGHLTCMECMQGMVDSGMKLDCPTCRKSFAFGSSFGVIISKKK